MDPTFIYCGKEKWEKPGIWIVALWWIAFFVLLPLVVGYQFSRDPKLAFMCFFSYFLIQTDRVKVDEGEKICYRAAGKTIIYDYIFLLVSGAVYVLNLVVALPFSMSQTTLLALWIAVLIPVLLSLVGCLYIVVMMKFNPPTSIPILMYEDRTLKFMTSENVLIENEEVQMS